eukprot:COSAG02_NODE_10672_length_1886_cov_1.420257_4_plen_93_part_00
MQSEMIMCAGLLLLQLQAPLAAADGLGEKDRLRHLQRASGLLSEAERLQSKYNPTAGTLPPFPNSTAGTFSPAFSAITQCCSVSRRKLRCTV